MDETVDLQGTAIGAGTIAALAFAAYGRYVGGSMLGLDPSALALVAFALTAASLAILHASYGRRDFAGAYALAAIGLLLVAPAAAPVLTIAGYILLVVGGAYVAVATVRARRDSPEGDRA